jgi:hypothetical protein
MGAYESPAPLNVDDLLAQARSRLRRLDPAVAFRAATTSRQGKTPADCPASPVNSGKIASWITAERNRP